jgi:diguanylate cyclase (GGDEF)-like protein
MGDGLRTIHVVTTDETLAASARAAALPLGGFEVIVRGTLADLMSSAPSPNDVILLDGWLRNSNVYENCRRLSGKTRARIFVVVEYDNTMAESIARFCGAAGVMRRPLVPSKMREAFESVTAPPAALPSDARGHGPTTPTLPEKLLTDIAGKPDLNLVGALTDPETSLFNYAFLNYKLDEEFKRAKRFDQPLSCVMLGFEGQVEEPVLRELAGIFLEASRDTDILGRFDENSFLFFLPNTPKEGAAIMARRVGEMAAARGLVDLVGDKLVISCGISCTPHSDVRRREDLFARARKAFFEARQEGGGVVAAV